jgi:hypothetical protein
LGEVFLLGHWKNYEDLEENLSMPELLQTLKSMHEKEQNQRKFAASLKGIQFDDEAEEKKGPTFEDIQRRALGIQASGDDVVSLQGSFAQEAGFGIGMGLGYSKE